MPALSTPSQLAVIVVVPAARAGNGTDTRPSPPVVPDAGSAIVASVVDAKVIVAPDTGSPSWSSAVAVAIPVVPTSSVVAGIDRFTVVTATTSTTCSGDRCESAVTVTWVDPPATPVARTVASPLASVADSHATVATPVSVDAGVPSKFSTGSPS